MVKLRIIKSPVDSLPVAMLPTVKLMAIQPQANAYAPSKQISQFKGIEFHHTGKEKREAIALTGRYTIRLPSRSPCSSQISGQYAGWRSTDFRQALSTEMPRRVVARETGCFVCLGFDFDFLSSGLLNSDSYSYG
jgi:hypothetical protein